MTTSTSAHQSEKKTHDDMDTSSITVPARTTTLSGAIFNLTKSAVGAGTVYLPAIFCVLGPLLSIPILFAGAIFCAISLYFLGRMAHHCETGDYFKLGRLALGRHGETAVSASLLLYLIGGLIAYAYLTGSYISSSIGSLMKEAKPEETLLSSGNLTLFTSLALVFPLSCLRDMSLLAKTSIFGMIAMTYIVGLLSFDAITYGTSAGIASDLARGTSQPTLTTYEYLFEICGSIGKLIFAFINHFTIVALVPVMKDPSAKSRMKLITVSTLAATIIYLTAAMAGYHRFGSLTIGTDALSVFKGKADCPLPYTIAQMALGLVLICSYPLLCDPARSCMDSLLFGPASKVSASFRHYFETAVIVFVPSVAAYFLKDRADNFLSLFSGFCGSLLVFSFPGIFFVILSRRFKYSCSKTEKSLAYFCVVLGIVLAILSSIVNVIKIYRGFSQQQS